uniref:Putative reverse transcriptase, RNA-dependent DNA polymerase, Gag-polypeptide of LTR copia-type n=1 Tax=Tanacetum cinerariifolium TaxID=118510 RepID=A0A6L2JUS7_TANCI|nr:putative reverse transcriptase, RNA-dependent DNA polymerase, Gag-polypeptide of LTR copia-type [Tanacetum cinerariifolium]
MSSRNSSPGFTSEQVNKILSLINETPIASIHANMAGHLNGTLATISYVGNLKLTNNAILYDVLVVPGYCVSLLFVNKLIRDSKMFVGFDENKCYIQDWKREKVLGTGSKNGGLYMFDMNTNCYVGKSNVVLSFHVSKLLWHNSLGHLVDQVLFVLKNDLSISKNSSMPMCEFCHRAKQTMEPFPSSDHKSKSLVKCFKAPMMIGRIHQLRMEVCNLHLILQILYMTPGLRSTRQFKFPMKLNDYVLSSNIKYRIKKYVNYSKLKGDNLCFDTTLNKSIKPTCLSDALFDPSWIESMNNEMESLNKNNTWTEFDLLHGRKPIGCKWIWKIKYKASGEVERYKARLVAKWFSQREGFNYDETFSHVVKMAPRQWNAKLTTTLIEHGFEQSKFDYSLYVKKKGSMFVALLVYVDGIVIT